MTLLSSESSLYVPVKSAVYRVSSCSCNKYVTRLKTLERFVCLFFSTHGRCAIQLDTLTTMYQISINKATMRMFIFVYLKADPVRGSYSNASTDFAWTHVAVQRYLGWGGSPLLCQAGKTFWVSPKETDISSIFEPKSVSDDWFELAAGRNEEDQRHLIAKWTLSSCFSLRLARPCHSPTVFTFINHKTTLKPMSRAGIVNICLNIYFVPRIKVLTKIKITGW